MLSLLFLTVSDVNAGVTTPQNFSSTFALDYSVEWTSSNTTVPMTYTTENGFDYTHFLYYSTKQEIFVSDPTVYAYKISAYGSGTTNYYGGGDCWTAPVVGTASQLVSADCVYGQHTSYDWQEDFWFVNDYSEQSVYMAFMNYLYTFSNGADVQVAYPQYYYNVSMTITPYFTSQAYELEKELNTESNEIAQQGNDLAQQGNEIAQQQTEEMQKQTEIMEEQAEEEKGFFASVLDFFFGFFDNLMNAIVGIFVPTGDEMSELFDRLNQFFSDTFGFLYFPFDFLIRLFDVFINSEVNNNVTLTFPGFSIMGYQVWDDIEVSVVQGGTPIYRIFYYTQTGMGIILSCYFVSYLRNFFEKRFGGGGN